jgi:large conductance mechanosensitive channel
MNKNLKYQKLELENKAIKKEIENFKKFAFKGDMIKISVGIIIGNSFNSVVRSISDNLIMPFINFLILKSGRGWRNWKIEINPHLIIEMGQFLGNVIDFLLISIILYIVYMKLMNNLFDKKEE